MFIVLNYFKCQIWLILLFCLGPAPAGQTDKIYELTKHIKEYNICPDLKCDISKVGTQKYTIEGGGEYTVQVIDSVQDYLQLMKEIFDFNALKAVITGSGGGHKVNILANALSGGVYCMCASLCYLHSCLLWIRQIYDQRWSSSSLSSSLLKLIQQIRFLLV